MNNAFFGISLFADLPFDTWLTIGDSYTDPASKTFGLDLESGFENSNLSLGGSNPQGAVFRSDDHPLCFLTMTVMYY